MTLNCKDLSFYTKNRNFKVPLKLGDFLKNIAFSPKVLHEVLSFINPLINLPNLQSNGQNVKN